MLNDDVCGNDGNRGESRCGRYNSNSRSGCHRKMHGRNRRYNCRQHLLQKHSLHYVRGSSLAVKQCIRSSPCRYGYSFCGMQPNAHGRSLRKNCNSLLYAHGNRPFGQGILLCAPCDVRTSLQLLQHLRRGRLRPAYPARLKGLLQEKEQQNYVLISVPFSYSCFGADTLKGKFCGACSFRFTPLYYKIFPAGFQVPRCKNPSEVI